MVNLNLVGSERDNEIMAPLSFYIFSSDKDLIAKIDIDDAF